MSSNVHNTSPSFPVRKVVVSGAVGTIGTLAFFLTILGIISVLGAYNVIGVGALSNLGVAGSWSLLGSSTTLFLMIMSVGLIGCSVAQRKKKASHTTASLAEDSDASPTRTFFPTPSGENASASKEESEREEEKKITTQAPQGSASVLVGPPTKITTLPDNDFEESESEEEKKITTQAPQSSASVLVGAPTKITALPDNDFEEAEREEEKKITAQPPIPLPQKRFESVVSVAPKKIIPLRNDELNDQLFNALIKKDGNYASELISQGANVNATNASGFTPLHIAARNKLINVVYELLDAGANIDAINDWNATPLHAALYSRGTQKIAMLLIERGARLDIKDIIGRTPMMLAKGLQIAGLKDMIDREFAAHTEQRAAWKEQSKRKLCGHAFKIKGYSFFTKKDGSQEKFPLILIGSRYDCWFLKMMQRWIVRFSNDFSDLLPKEHANIISKALKFTSQDSEKSDEDYLKRIQSGKLTLLLVGYKHHAATWLFYNGTIIEINRGPNRKSGTVVVFDYEPKNLKANIINDLRKSKTECNKDEWFNLKDQLISSLEMKELEKLQNHLQINAQLAGNCTYDALEGAIFGIQVLFALNNHTNRSIWEKILEERKTFTNLVFHFQLEVLENYLKWQNSNKSPYYYDSFLLTRITELLFAQQSGEIVERKEIDDSKVIDERFQKKIEILLSQISELTSRDTLPNLKPSSWHFRMDYKEYEKTLGRSTPNYMDLFEDYFFL